MNRVLSAPCHDVVTVRASVGRPLRIAVIGAGPAGFYTAGHLLDSDVDVVVDLVDRLPTPYGLVRSGVAPDHPKLKSVTRVFEAIAARPGLRFLGNVEVGAAVTVAELSEWYDGVVYAVGAATHRRSGVPGEDLAGSLSATEFVGWSNGHPDHRDVEVELSVERALVVGNGNVALDVARILLQVPAELARTDIADHALAALRASTVREVVVLGRRGPAQSSFSAQELRELGELSGVEIAVEPPGPHDIASGDAAAAKSLRVVCELAERRAEEAARRLVLRFLWSPAEILGQHRVEGVRIVRNRLVMGEDGTVLAQPTGESTVLPVGLVVRAIGYRGEPSPDSRSTSPGESSPTTAAASERRTARPAEPTWPGGSSVGPAGLPARTAAVPRTPSRHCWRTPAPGG